MVKDRLLDICAALNISASELSTSIGMSRPYIANLKKDITTEVLLNIHITYPSVNIMRIITGEGDILITNNPNNSNDMISYLMQKIENLETENKTLIKEIGYLEGQLKEVKKLVPKEENAICATASGSTSEK